MPRRNAQHSIDPTIPGAEGSWLDSLADFGFTFCVASSGGAKT
jgi:hypothetical protein